MKSHRQSSLPGIFTPGDVIEIRGLELDSFESSLKAQNLYIMRLDVWRVSGWRVLVGRLPAGRAAPPDHLSTRPPGQTAAVGGAGRFREAPPRILGLSNDLSGEAMMSGSNN